MREGLRAPAVGLRQDQGDPGREHLLADAGRRAPRRRRGSRGTRRPRNRSGSRPARGPASVRRPVSSSTVGATCLTNLISAPTGVHSRSATSATSLPIAVSIIRVKSAARPAGSATMSARAEQRGGDPGDLLDLPVGADAAGVAGEAARAGVERGPQLLRRLVLVAAVGEQDAVPDRRPRRRPAAGRRAAARCRSPCRRPRSAGAAPAWPASRVAGVGDREPPVARVDLLGHVGAARSPRRRRRRAGCRSRRPSRPGRCASSSAGSPSSPSSRP